MSSKSRYLAIFFAAVIGHAQPAPEPAFEVVSVKPFDFEANRPGNTTFHVEPGRAWCTCMMSLMLEEAYRIRPLRINGPNWLADPISGHVPLLYQLDARFPATTNTDQVPAMLRTMLADRFHLQAHRENRDDPVYALRILPGGLKLKPAPPPEPPDPSLPPPQNYPFPTVLPGTISMNGNSLELKIHGALTFFKLAWFLTAQMDRDVVDQTGDPAEYEIDLDSRISAPRHRPQLSAYQWADDDPRLANIPSIFSEIQKLGLKLEPSRAPIEHLVIDRIESLPTPN